MLYNSLYIASVDAAKRHAKPSRMSNLYLLGLGSNQRHPVIGSPERILNHALDALEMDDIDLFSHSPIVATAPVGPSARRYANAAAIVASALSPPEMLDRLHKIEAHFGRERRGQRWRARTLDLDILLWSGGMWVEPDSSLAIPHPQLHTRGFVLEPASIIAGNWRDPITGLALKQLAVRFKRPKRVDRAETAH